MIVGQQSQLRSVLPNKLCRNHLCQDAEVYTAQLYQRQSRTHARVKVVRILGVTDCSATDRQTVSDCQ